MKIPFASAARVLHTAAFHKWATLFWIALAVPTVLWWRESVFWVALMSLYANVASHWAAYQGARSEEKQERG